MFNEPYNYSFIFTILFVDASMPIKGSSLCKSHPCVFFLGWFLKLLILLKISFLNVGEL